MQTRRQVEQVPDAAVNLHFVMRVQEFIRGTPLTLFIPWQADREVATHAELAFHVDCAAHQVNRQFAQCQAQAGTLIPARKARIQLAEGLE